MNVLLENNNYNNSILTKGSWRTGIDYPNDSITKNVQNPETSPGDLRRLAVTQTPVEKPSGNTDVKNSKGVNNNNNY